MSEGTLYYVWPVADEKTLTVAILLVCGVFVGAVCLELYRRRHERALRLKAAWRGVKDICDERELLPEDWKLLRAILLQYAPNQPYAAITKRALFDECISHYFQALSTAESNEIIEARGVRMRDIRTQLGLDFVPLGRRIYTTRSLRVRQFCQMTPASGTPGSWLPCMISESNEATLRVVPTEHDSFSSFQPGALMKFRLWREEDARYFFEAPLLRVDAQNKAWIFKQVDTITRSQSRAYFRLRVEQAVAVAILNASINDDYEGVYEREPITEVRGRLTSLSGGGLAIAFQQPVPKQVLLRVPISLPGEGGVQQVVVRPIASQTLSGGRSHVRGMFVAMGEETRESITRYIFSKQKLLAGRDGADS